MLEVYIWSPSTLFIYVENIIFVFDNAMQLQLQ